MTCKVPPGLRGKTSVEYFFSLFPLQDLRGRALLGPRYSPFLSDSLTPMQWCILERIGRSRTQGEVTQGKVSLQFTGESPKTLFYHRKALLKHRLIRKQVHHQKIGVQNFQVVTGKKSTPHKVLTQCFF